MATIKKTIAKKVESVKARPAPKAPSKPARKPTVEEWLAAYIKAKRAAPGRERSLANRELARIEDRF